MTLQTGLITSYPTLSTLSDFYRMHGKDAFLNRGDRTTYTREQNAK
jgi:hypothetical protein